MEATGFAIAMAISFAVVFPIGMAIGIAVGRRYKPWSELTESEKRLRIKLVAVGAILVVAGIVAGISVSFSYGR